MSPISSEATSSDQPMPYAFVQDVAASWEDYQQVTAALIEPTPEGLILHVAGPTDEGVRTIDVWESEQAWQRFHAERLAPAIAALGGPARPEPTFRALRPPHVVIGSRGRPDRPLPEEAMKRLRRQSSCHTNRPPEAVTD